MRRNNYPPTDSLRSDLRLLPAGSSEKGAELLGFIHSKLLSCLGSKGELGAELCFECLLAKIR